jgi:hypothetical protein
MSGDAGVGGSARLAVPSMCPTAVVVIGAAMTARRRLALSQRRK